MKALIVVAHPRHDSFTHALAQRFAEGVEAAGHDAEFAGLYQEGFDPLVSVQELDGWREKQIPPEVRAWQERIRGSDGLVLAYPVWWSTPPAILSGWLQRVFTQDFAFSQAGGRAEGLLRLRAQLLVSIGSRQREDIDLAAHYLEPMQGVLSYCGMTLLPAQANWGVHPQAEKTALEAHVEQAFENGKRFFA